jgi:hypothetical protein
MKKHVIGQVGERVSGPKTDAQRARARREEMARQVQPDRLLRALCNGARRLYVMAQDGKAPEPLLELLRSDWQVMHCELDRRELAKAERKDKGVVCWERFSPRCKDLRELSIFNQQKHIIRTPRRRFAEGGFFTEDAEWTLASEGPYEELARLMREDMERFDLEQFRRYGQQVKDARARWLAKQNAAGSLTDSPAH